MNKQISIVEAKNKLPSIIHDVEQGPPATLTRRGTPVAVLISMRQYESLCRAKPDFWNSLVRFRQSLKNNKETLSDADFDNIRDMSTGRNIDL
ncbi:hypothetical protein MNBD_DELTA03-947 [hydrothermal vent metagenome]|uniref:Antitoxin n=1 Tax=hydrothermal vent metagenome TaxID=652676 RepID=A0A3B0W7C1_9ZZZZ